MTDAAAQPGVHGVGVRAIGSRGAWILLLSVIAVGVALDLATKSLAFARIPDTPLEVKRNDVLATPIGQLQGLIPPHEPVIVVPHVLELKLVLNAGAVFGFGQGNRVFFITFTLAALGFAIWIFGWCTAARDRVAHIAIGLVISGGLGNLYDRVRFACVRDFLHPLPTANKPFGMTWPNGDAALWPYVSNVADAILLIGIGLLVIRLWRAGPPITEANEMDDSSGPGVAPTGEEASA